jgi:TrmH family RNA methyltransferase
MTREALRESAHGGTTRASASGEHEARPGAGDVNALGRAFREARESDELVVLEGFHPLKHALRFGASVITIVTYDVGELHRLARDHAPERSEEMATRAIEVERKDFRRLGPYEPHTGVVSIARRVAYEPHEILADPREAPAVLLDEPRHRGNLGAVVRAAAAAGAAGVLNTGPLDPWHPVVVRGAAGLQFAIPVARLEALPDRERLDRPLLVFDPAGEPLGPSRVDSRSVLVFGSERRGVGAELIARADARLRLPMREGVSSLNLATAVAAVLYGIRVR